MFRQGDIVTVKDSGNNTYKQSSSPLYYKITSIDKNKAKLSGLIYRLKIEADISSIEAVNTFRFLNFTKLFLDEADKKINSILDQRSKESSESSALSKKPGTVLHVDADRDYLKMCLSYYKKLGVPVHGEHVDESQQPTQITHLLNKYTPDIVVITGHDSIKKDAEWSSEDYKSSTYFVEAVKSARNYQSSKDSLVIIAGACQSNYEALITAGANIASSPKRIIIHALDPVLASEKIAYTPINQYINIPEILTNTLSGTDGLGGIQTRGSLRLIYP